MANFAAPPVEVPPITIGIERPSEDFIRNSTRRVELSVSGGKRLERLDKLHEAMKISLGGLYPCPEVVQAILAPVAGETKRVLDIGCGSRIWSVEMAREFPHVEVLGLDVPQAIEHWKGEYPKNARFEATNFQFAMPEKYLNRFDIIHLRFIASAFSQFQKSLEEIQDCLKPGGLLILVDSTGLIMGEDKVSVPRMRSSSNPNGSQLQRLFYEIRNANASLGLDEFAMRATLEEGLWDNTQLDECGAAEVLVPIGGWVQATDPVVERNLRKAGRLMGQNLEHIQHSHHHMLQNLGFPTGLSREWKKIDKWISQKSTTPTVKRFWTCAFFGAAAVQVTIFPPHPCPYPQWVQKRVTAHHVHQLQLNKIDSLRPFTASAERIVNGSESVKSVKTPMDGYPNRLHSSFAVIIEALVFVFALFFCCTCMD